MGLDNTGCAADLQSCNYSYPSVYQGSTVGAEIDLHLENLACDANDGSYCGVLDICTAQGELLTIIGERLGWPREHCNVKPVDFFGLECTESLPDSTGCNQASIVGLCDGAFFFCRLNGNQNYTFDNDEFYRSFLKAVAIKNRGRVNKELETVKLIREIIKALWGDEAWIVSVGANAIGVSAGRDLVEEEICLLSLYESIICTGLGIRLELHCMQPTRPEPCPFQIVNCPEDRRVRADENFEFVNLGGVIGGVPPYTVSQIGPFFPLINPTGVTFIGNSDGTYNLSGKAGTTSEKFNYAVSITDSNGDTVECNGNCLTIVGSLNSPPVAPINENITCNVGQPFSYTSPPFVDDDGDTVTFFVPSTSLPVWATFTDNGDNTYTITGTPLVPDISIFTITARDGNGGSANHTIDITCV